MKIDYAALGFTLAGAMIAVKVAEMLIEYSLEMIVGVCL